MTILIPLLTILWLIGSCAGLFLVIVAIVSRRIHAINSRKQSSPLNKSRIHCTHYVRIYGSKK
jgi:beta-lactamase regulating signal transducer with metallopeptidase domain